MIAMLNLKLTSNDQTLILFSIQYLVDRTSSLSCIQINHCFLYNMCFEFKPLQSSRQKARCPDPNGIDLLWVIYQHIYALITSRPPSPSICIFFECLYTLKDKVGEQVLLFFFFWGYVATGLAAYPLIFFTVSYLHLLQCVMPPYPINLSNNHRYNLNLLEWEFVWLVHEDVLL